MSKIYIIGTGPGNRQHMTEKALTAIEKSEVIIGYETYLNLIAELITNKTVFSSKMRKEKERCQQAIDLALKGKAVSLISGGDPGIYGMAGILLELIKKEQYTIDVEIIPGISAVNAAAAVLGAPLMHDFVCISLSDLLTDWQLIKKRIHCAAQGDFVIALYNPCSRKRINQIKEAQQILLKYKDKSTPVGVVKNGMRDQEESFLTSLDMFLDYPIDMSTLIIIGNSHTYIADNKMITPRGYSI
ncbi:MAG: precorrin-3B C(17)-methyltransferase [Spirochaetes bacterium]|nr:precorrin-3B C(17)-methyltransferase [Spirochaetota bacterium]